MRIQRYYAAPTPDYGTCTTGEIIAADCGYRVLDMPQPENL